MRDQTAKPWKICEQLLNAKLWSVHHQLYANFSLPRFRLSRYNDAASKCHLCLLFFSMTNNSAIQNRGRRPPLLNIDRPILHWDYPTSLLEIAAIPP
jgi:hypothetical protein